MIKIFASESFKSQKAILGVGSGILIFSSIGAIALSPVFNSMLETTVSRYIPLVTVEQLGEINKSQSLVFVDVRTPQEYQRDRIRESYLVPLDAIERGIGVEKVQEIAAKHPHSAIVLYCQRGPRSHRAYQHLKKTGLHFFVLSGGITAWRKVER